MALSGAERARRCREKKKAAGLSQVMKEKDRQRKRLARAKMSLSKLKALRLRQQVNLHRFRAKVKATDGLQSSCMSSFPTKQAKGKALKKVMNALPINKDKKIELIQKIAEDLNLLKLNNKYERVKQSLPTATKDKIYEYYFRSDVSYQAPGKKDTITIKENGIKKKLQKRYLFYSLRELHQLFLEENPNITVSLSMFQELRPPNVLYKSCIPHNVCCCVYHENVILLLKSLNEHIQGLNSISLQSFIQLIVCDDTRELCMFSKCAQCAVYFKDKIQNKIIDSTAVIKWTLWSTSTEGRFMKIDYKGPILECVVTLESKIKHFLFHVFVKRQQSNFFEFIKNNLNDQCCLLQVDYSENFSIVSQNEIQNAHFSKKQLSLFTAYIWAQSITYPMVIVSNDPSHNKYTVSLCLQRILIHLKKMVPSLTKLIIFSDGSACQFKQRYLFKNLTFLAEQFSINLSWNFFASHHGKGK